MQIVLTSFANETSAAKVVRTLVEEKLAACGKIIPGVRSIYRWNDQLEDASEIIVLFKTAVAPALAVRLAELHPYEVPEIITLESDAVSEAYGRWVASRGVINPGKASA